MRKLLLYIMLLLALITKAQTYDFRNYNVEDGLAQSQVMCIFQDSKGYMWFGTNGGGASRYDGKNFKTFNTANGCISNYVYSVAEDKNNDLYFGTYDGLQIKNGGKSVKLDTNSGLPHNTVYKALISKSGKVWIGTQKGVCLLENNKPVILKGDEKLQKSAVFTVYEDGEGNLWFGTIQSGICLYSPAKNTFTWYDTQSGLHDNFIRSFVEDNKGNMLVGTVAGMFSIDNKTKKLSAVNIKGISLENLAITSICKDKNNTLWISMNEGFIKYNGIMHQKFLAQNGLCSNSLLSSYIDNEGNLWFGSDGAGLSRLSSEVISNYSVKDSLPGDYINSLYQTKDERIWIGMRDNGLMSMKNGKRMQLYKMNRKSPKENIIDNTVNCMSEDNEGNLWIGTQSGLSILNLKNNKILNYWAADVSEYSVIYSLLHSKDGKHYIGTSNGLVIFSGKGNKEPVSAVNNLNSGGDLGIYNILEDGNNIWVGTNKGAIKLEGKSAELFDKKNNFTDKAVYNIVKDKNNHLWFGTEDGVFYFDGKLFSNISEKDGLVSDLAYFMVFDNQERLWIGTNKGIDALNTHEYLANKKINVKHLGKAEGLKGLECNMNAAIKDSEGKLWFGTVKGATIFNPRYEKINYREPSNLITDIKIFFEKAELAPYSKGIDSLSGLPVGLELPYAKNHITIDYIGISQTNPDKVQYQFKLEGVDADWVPVTSKTEVTYSSLQPKKYTFYLKAMNNDGIWNEEPLTFTFTVLPPWYRTWWFYTLCVIIVLASAYWYNVYKTKKLYADKVKLEKQVASRTRELREEKEKVELINKEVIEQKATIEHKNLEITDSIKYAKNIQEALLPNITNLQKDFPESFVLYLPKDIVSGDFYWFNNRGGKNFVAAADCTGHGVPGAFMSIIGNSLLNEIISEQHVYQPGEILNNLHVGVKGALNQNKGEFERRDGMDIALCAFDKDKLTLEYAGANRPLWLYRKGQDEIAAEIIKADKFPIGGLEFEFEEKRRFTNHTFQMQKGDSIYIFSDGYADQFGGPKGKKFMVANLQRVLNEITDLSMKEQYERLYKAFTDWRGSYEQIDDVLVIGVRV